MKDEWVFGILVASVGFLIKYAMDRNTNEVKGLRDDIGRLFEREEKSSKELVAVQENIKRIDERCNRHHPVEGT
jgi:hypothetical protein